MHTTIATTSSSALTFLVLTITDREVFSTKSKIKDMSNDMHVQTISN